jgi:hypothetical protein
MALQYLDDLKIQLTELATISKKMGELESKKELIRSQIDKWLTLNKLETFEVYDNKNQIWRIWRSTTARYSIADYTILKEVLGEENGHLVVSKESTALNVRTAKKFSPEWLAAN